MGVDHTANADTKTYDGLAYNGGNGYGITGFVNGEDASVFTGGSVVYTGTSQGAVNAGVYDLDIDTSTLTAQNYTFDYVNSTLTINKAGLTVTADNTGKVYDGNTYSGGYTYSLSGFVNGETESVFTGGNVVFGGSSQTAVNAGTYDIDIQGSTLTADNYNFTYVNGTLTIDRAALTLTANNQSKTFGQTFVFNGSEYAITSGTLYGADSITDTGLSSLGSPALAPAGSYPITFGKLAGTGLDNYDITTVNGTMTVNPAPRTTIFTNALGRPVISVANQAIVLDQQFEPIEVKTLDTNVAIGMQQPTAQFLANLEPAAGGEMTAEELAKMEPAAGPGVGGGASGNADIACANDFLNNQPCAIDQ